MKLEEMSQDRDDSVGDVDRQPAVRQVVNGPASPTRSQLLLVALLYALCVGSTFISYQPCVFRWDNSDYFARTIRVSRAFWSGNKERLREGIVSIRPPIMTLMGLPWGPLMSWDAAGRSFITLASLISVLSVASLYLLLRIGIKPAFLVAASICVYLSLGPYVSDVRTRQHATGFEADSLFAWIVLAGVLLIPYEARVPRLTIRGSVFRSMLWAVILGLGVMTKLSFLFFVGTIMPVLVFLKLLRSGLRNTLAALIALACCSVPVAFYLLRWGDLAFLNAKASSFGPQAMAWFVPLGQFLGNTVRESPGLVLIPLFTAFAFVYFGIHGRFRESWPDVIALLITLSFVILVLRSPNRQIRYAFPAIVALPFLGAVLVSPHGRSVPRKLSAVAAGLALGGLLLAGMPTRHRPEWQSLMRCNAILAAAPQWHAERILLATDSPNLNGELMTLATLFSSPPAMTDYLAFQAMRGVPIEQDLRILSKADLVVFQDRHSVAPLVTNQRILEYESYAQRIGVGPIRVTNDTVVYLIRESRADRPALRR